MAFAMHDPFFGALKPHDQIRTESLADFAESLHDNELELDTEITNANSKYESRASELARRSGSKEEKERRHNATAVQNLAGVFCSSDPG